MVEYYNKKIADGETENWCHFRIIFQGIKLSSLAICDLFVIIFHHGLRRKPTTDGLWVGSEALQTLCYLLVRLQILFDFCPSFVVNLWQSCQVHGFPVAEPQSVLLHFLLCCCLRHLRQPD